MRNHDSIHRQHHTMKTTGIIVSLKVNGEEIGKMTEYECDTSDLADIKEYEDGYSGSFDFEYFDGACDYFMKALMYALTFKN